MVTTVLTEQKVLAVDIESSASSYEGFICLIQFAYYSEENQKIEGFVFDIMEIMADCKQSSNDQFSMQIWDDVCKDFLGSMIFEN